MTRALTAPDKASPDDKPVFFLQGDPTSRLSMMRSGALIPVSPKMNKVNGYCTPVFLRPAPALQAQRSPLELSLGGELAKAATGLLNEIDPDTFLHGIDPLRKALEAWAMGKPLSGEARGPSDAAFTEDAYAFSPGSGNKARRRMEALQKPKCDGNHGWPRCADPECWNDDSLPDPHKGCSLNAGGAHNDKGPEDLDGCLTCTCGFMWELPF